MNRKNTADLKQILRTLPCIMLSCSSRLCHLIALTAVLGCTIMCGRAETTLEGEWVGGGRTMFGPYTMKLVLNNDGTCRCKIINQTKPSAISIPSTDYIELDGTWQENEGVDLDLTIKSWVRKWPANTPGAGATERAAEMKTKCNTAQINLFLSNSVLSCPMITIGKVPQPEDILRDPPNSNGCVQLLCPELRKDVRNTSR
jgi:hypothetical protein